MNLNSLIKKHEEDIVKYAEKFLSSKTGQDLIKKNVEKELKNLIEEDYIEELLSSENKKKFWDNIQKAIAKRLGLN